MVGLNYGAKALYVAVKPLEDAVEDSAYGIRYNCFVFDPLFDRAHPGAMNDYDEFFKNSARVQMLPVVTEQGPGELAKTLEKQYGAVCHSWVGGMTAPVHVPAGSIDKLVKDLTKDPVKYFTSKEKKMFG
jgi:hypothetical protein